MYKVIKKYQKKLLAIFSVLLMVAFLAMLGPGTPGGRGGRSETIVGRMNGGTINENDLQAAKDQWRILMQTMVNTGQSFGQDMPLPYRVLPVSTVQEIEKHPELFLLLQKEAEQRGIVVGLDEAKSIWVNRLNRAIETVSPVEVLAIRNIFMISGEIDQLADAAKVSRPMWQREAAQQFQGVRLNLVDYRADEFEKTIAAPTPQQLQEQFDKYKNTPARQADSVGDDSLGFGYQIPTRVTLQYLEIPKAQVVASLQPTPESKYEWEVKAAVYYQSHLEEFRNPETQPASQPATTQSASTQSASTQSASTQSASTQSASTQSASTQSASSQSASTQSSTPASMPAIAASQPAIKPFAQVKDEIVDKLMAPDVAKQLAIIEKELKSQLAADWISIRKANGAATQPATTQTSASQPATSQPAAAEMTFARLEAIRADIQQKLHVSVELHEISGWQDSKQLAALTGIGTTMTADHDRFSDYALNFTGQSAMMSAVALQVWEPSQALTDTAGNSYVFRLTAAEPAHAPADMTPLLAQITKDWRMAQAYEMAKQAGTKLAASAKANGLAQASRTAGVTVLATGQFSPRNPRSIPGYPLTDPLASQDLGQAARKLLEQATQTDPHPTIFFEMPTVQRAGVAELASARLELPEWYVQTEVVNSSRQTERSKLGEEWFAYNAVVDRLGYKAEAKSGSGS